MKLPDLIQQFKRYSLHERAMTAYNYRAIVRNVCSLMDYAKTENVKKIDEGIIRTFLSDMSEQRAWAPKTYRTFLQNLTTFFKWCQLTGVIKKNPTENIQKPKLPRRLPRTLTKDKALLILVHTSTYPWRYHLEQVRNETIIATFLLTGLRLKELINLKVYDVNLSNNELLVSEGKGGKDRIIPIHPRLVIILRNYFQELKKHRKKQSTYLFTGVHSDKPLASKNIQEICRKVSNASGIKFTPHMLRHTFARLSIDADLNLYKLKEIMGHNHVSTTQVYLSVSTESIKKSFNSLSLL